ncbi:MAG: phenylalanine--tRNA ligase subunit alpha [Thermodesulfovibrionia bacterium]
MIEELQSINASAISEIKIADSLPSLTFIRAKYLGKKGLITEKIRSIPSIPKEIRAEYGRLLNSIKKEIEDALREREEYLKGLELERRLRTESIDVTLPGFYIPQGHLHPSTRVLNEIIEIFVSLGFSVMDGPEVELDYYNFEALNIPKDHPARDMQDTFYISEDVVLRTHTSPVQVRVMEAHTPPLSVVVPGKVYRCDADISHIPMFHQIEGFMVDERISMSDLKGILEVFAHEVFGHQVSLRFRPSYFPFTEPSAEVDISCVLCKGLGCKVCKDSGWVEILGAGMINPRVFEMAGYPPDRYTGFAFGMGIERIAMLKYGINDIRLFLENDKRFLEQF